jgi:hypothetical protein
VYQLHPRHHFSRSSMTSRPWLHFSGPHQQIARAPLHPHPRSTERLRLPHSLSADVVEL